MASKLKRYDELSQEDKDMVDSALASIKESVNRTAQVREENQVNRDAMMKRGRYRDWETDRKSTRLNSSHSAKSRMPSSA